VARGGGGRRPLAVALGDDAFDGTGEDGENLLHRCTLYCDLASSLVRIAPALRALGRYL
jgi:hypothetical protein